MPEIKKKISEICDVCKSDKSLTKRKIFQQENLYPVFAATIGVPIGFIDRYNNDRFPALIVVNDGAAGKTYIIEEEKYVIGKHATGLLIKEEYSELIDIRYLRLITEPLWIEMNKCSGRGNLPKTDILNTYISLPLNDVGEIDFERQKEVADNFQAIGEQREKLEALKYSLLDTYVSFESMLSEYDITTISFNDYFDLKRGKIISKKYIDKHGGEYPVYSTQQGVFGKIDTYMYSGEYLLWNTDGLAGFIKYVTGEFSLTNIEGIMLPKKDLSNISLQYLKYILEPIFRFNKKGREGVLGKNEYTKLNSTMIKELNIQIPIPIKEDGTFDLDAQKELSLRYMTIDEVKSKICADIDAIIDVKIDL